MIKELIVVIFCLKGFIQMQHHLQKKLRMYCFLIFLPTKNFKNYQNQAQKQKNYQM